MAESTDTDPVTRALSFIVDISEPDFENLLRCLEEEPLPQKESEVESRVQKALPDLDEDAVEVVVGFSTAFGGAVSQMTDRERFLNNLSRRARGEIENLNPEDLKSRLLKLFYSPAIAFIGGGKAALRDNVRTVTRSNINSDLRPIKAPGNLAASYFSIIHRMKVDYSDEAGSGAESAIELVLDHESLSDLKDQIQVALDAEASMKDSVNGWGGSVFWPYADNEGENGNG